MMPGADLFPRDDRHIDLVADNPVPSVISVSRLPDNPIVACNAVFCDLTGYSTEEVIGRDCRFLSDPATEPWLTKKIRRGMREHRPVLVEVLNYKRNGQPFRNVVIVAPIYDQHEALLHFLGTQAEIDANASSPSSMRGIGDGEMFKSLSPRQRQVLKLVANALLNKQIAAELDVAKSTVKMHRTILIKRLGLHTTADLFLLAVEATPRLRCVQFGALASRLPGQFKAETGGFAAPGRGVPASDLG